MKKLIMCLLLFTLIFSACSDDTQTDENENTNMEDSNNTDENEDTEVSEDKDKAENIDFDAVFSQIEDAYRDKMGDTENVSDTIMETVYSLGSEEVEDYAGLISVVNVQAHEILLVKAVDGQEDAVREAIENRAKDLDAQWESYLPAQHELVKNYSLMEKDGYFLFIIHEDKEKALEIFEEEI